MITFIIDYSVHFFLILVYKMPESSEKAHYNFLG